MMIGPHLLPLPLHIALPIYTNNVLELSKTPGVGNDGSCLVATMENVATGWAAQFLHPDIGNVVGPTKGILLSNATAATTGATNEEYSPMLALEIGRAHV